MLLNLVVAVILENFTSLGNINPQLVSASDFELFKEAWQGYDPEATQDIPTQSLPDLILDIPPPLGIKGLGTRVQAERICMKLDVVLHGSDLGSSTVSFKDVVDVLVRYNGETMFTDEFKSVEASVVKSIRRERQGSRKCALPPPPLPPTHPPTNLSIFGDA